MARFVFFVILGFFLLPKDDKSRKETKKHNFKIFMYIISSKGDLGRDFRLAARNHFCIHRP